MNYKFFKLDIVRWCRNNGQSQDQYIGWLHANGMRPVECERLARLLRTIGIDDGTLEEV